MLNNTVNLCVCVGGGGGVEKGLRGTGEAARTLALSGTVPVHCYIIDAWGLGSEMDQADLYKLQTFTFTKD